MADTTQSEDYYLISWVARRYDVHPQTLRLYEREGLLRPSRTRGNTRLYSASDLERLETILGLTRDMGINLAGVDVILRLRERLAELQRELERLAGNPG
jgi:MerR family transcriptional regulator/heat shock protein HspR